MNHLSSPRYLNKPPFVRIYPRARIIFREGIWNAHIIHHPIETPDKTNRVGWGTRKHLSFLHECASRDAHTARARQEQP